jgi:hypothetical protein
MLRATAVANTEPGPWQVDMLEAKFGLTLTSEASVIVGKAGAQAAIEVCVTVKRSN